MLTLTERLAQLIVQDNAVLFIGAGLGHGQDQLPAIQRLAEALAGRIQYQRPDRSLAAVARDFEVLHGRNALILALREELEKMAGRPTSLHQLLADAMLPNSKVITSRFDQSLEQALEQFEKSYVRIVRDTDIPFFDETKIILIKIQGDITQPDSLVITEDDIDAFISRLPTVSDVVRAFFATKTLIFLGYDLSGEQFKRFFRQVTRNLSIFRRQAYAVIPGPVDEVEARYWRDQNVEIHCQEPMAFLEALAPAVKAAARRPRAATHPLAEAAAPSLPDRPYKALDSYTGADVAIFTGRAEESQRLTTRLLAHRLSVLYGESGSGKTSLLAAGAGPRLARQRALLVTTVPAPGQPLPEQLGRDLMAAGMQAGLPEAPPPDGLDAPAAASLPTNIRVWQRALDGPVVLALDQFEQFFLVYNAAEQQQALQVLAELLADRSLDLRLALVVREDFLGRLHSLEEVLPGLLDVRFRLERLGREAARLAIEEPARLYNVSWEPALVQTLLDDLYDPAGGGVAPPQLQLVCDGLYRAVVEPAGEAARERGLRITLADFRRLGGAEAILGEYLDRVVAEFSGAEQPLVRRLLAALVSSRGVKQRLSLAELAFAAETRPEQAAGLLDELTRQRLVRRYDLGGETSQLAYELTHDYLVSRIVAWLGDDFWAGQRARELVRQALPEWQERGRLLAPDDLRLVAAQQVRVRFTTAEAELLYAAAVAYDEQPLAWQASLPEADCRSVLLRLFQHPEGPVRGRAARRLAALPAAEAASTALVRAALSDPDPDVRLDAARAIGCSGGDSSPGAADQAALAQLVEAAAAPATAGPALQALAVVRDVQPESQALLPPSLAGPVRQRVWRARWLRCRYQILAATIRGLNGGFWGLGLGFGLFLGLFNAQNILSPRLLLGSALLGLSLAGLVGALAAGSGAFVRVVLQSLQDRELPWRTWAASTLVSSLFFSLGLVLVGAISRAVGDSPRTLPTMLAGFLIGGVVTGLAGLPVRLPWLLGLGLSGAAGVIVFWLAEVLGLLSLDSFGWLALMGGASGLGFFLALNPGPRQQNSAPVVAVPEPITLAEEPS